MPMDIVGTVVEILSDSHLLVKTNGRVTLNTDLTVYGKIAGPQLKERYGLDYLRMPKGSIRIVSAQDTYLYLARIFTTTQTVSIATRFNYDSLLSGAFRKEVIASPPSGVLSEPTIPLKLEIDKRIQVGDEVGTD